VKWKNTSSETWDKPEMQEMFKKTYGLGLRRGRLNQGGNACGLNRKGLVQKKRVRKKDCIGFWGVRGRKGKGSQDTKYRWKWFGVS